MVTGGGCPQEDCSRSVEIIDIGKNLSCEIEDLPNDGKSWHSQVLLSSKSQVKLRNKSKKKKEIDLTLLTVWLLLHRISIFATSQHYQLSLSLIKGSNDLENRGFKDPKIRE